MTSTSRFGTSKRESHDASDFYDRFPAPKLLDDTTVVDAGEVKDSVIQGDSRDLSMIPGASIALVVTSPPYFAGKEYEAAMGEGHVPASYVEYLEMLRDVFAECWRVLEPGGRVAVNVANLGRKPYRSLAGDVVAILQNDLGYLLRGEIVWIKGAGLNSSCAWGSYASASNPVLRDVTERIIIGSKGRFGRAITEPKREALGSAVREHDHRRGVPRAHPRHVAVPARVGATGRAPGAVPGGATATLPRAVHVQGRHRARPVRRRRDGGGRGRADGAPLRVRGCRCRLRREGARPRIAKEAQCST